MFFINFKLKQKKNLYLHYYLKNRQLIYLINFKKITFFLIYLKIKFKIFIHFNSLY